MASVSMLRSGWLADNIFTRNPLLKSLGATSKAVYLLSPGGEVVILSFDPWISPLTCTLDRYSPELRAITPGEEFAISPTSLTHSVINIQRDSAIIWKEPAPAGDILDPASRMQILLEAARKTSNLQNNGGFSPLLLPFLLDETPILDALDIYAHIIALSKSLSNPGVDAVQAACLPLLGRGRGLTPSGDDVLNGLLLFFNRWPALCPLPMTERQGLNLFIRNESRKRTTSLSANLLDLASQGTADERLIAAVDGLVTGTPPLEQWLPSLLSYGSSSGGDALLGMAITIRSNLVFPK